MARCDNQDYIQNPNNDDEIGDHFQIHFDVMRKYPIHPLLKSEDETLNILKVWKQEISYQFMQEEAKELEIGNILSTMHKEMKSD